MGEQSPSLTMDARRPRRRIPWLSIAWTLAGAAIVAWLVGFGAGLIVRLVTVP
jgi:hypothetical protein